MKLFYVVPAVAVGLTVAGAIPLLDQTGEYNIINRF